MELCVHDGILTKNVLPVNKYRVTAPGFRNCPVADGRRKNVQGGLTRRVQWWESSRRPREKRYNDRETGKGGIMRVAVVGLGGVGGYLGGKLARKYAGSREHTVIFIARGAHLAAIRKEGLLLKTVKKGRQTELELFIGFAARAGRALGIPMPLHEEFYASLGGEGIVRPSKPRFSRAVPPPPRPGR